MTEFTWKCVRECFMQTGRTETQNRLVLKKIQYLHNCDTFLSCRELVVDSLGPDPEALFRLSGVCS